MASLCLLAVRNLYVSPGLEGSRKRSHGCEKRDWKNDERMEMSVSLYLMRARTYMWIKEILSTLSPRLVSSISLPRHLGQR